VQVAACFKAAGWPGSLDCFDYAEWCKGIDSYCSSTCKKGKPGSCGKKDCFGKKPPKGNPPVVTTSVYPCPTTSTKTTTTTKSTSSSSCIPSPTGICKQPTNWYLGYGPGSPVGGIELPVLTCNDIASDWKNYPFKLYTNSDSKKCGQWPRPQVPSACAVACKEQYDDCVDVYAQGCKTYNHKRSASYFDFAARGTSENKKRWNFGDSWGGATNKCKAQYDDCLAENKNVNAGTKCGSFGTGW
jgi:hypothetical protein